MASRATLALLLVGTAAAFAPSAPVRRAARAARSAPLRSVSGVDALPELQQAAVVLGLFGGLGAGTFALDTAFTAVGARLPDGWWDSWKKTWPLLGAVYVAAGVAHFTEMAAFSAIVPPQGTWGFWYLPGSAEFHAQWSGVAEFLGGSGLLLGGLGAAVGNADAARLQRLSAACLLALTVAVTPANIYMYTHGALMVGLGPPGDIPVAFHAVRGVLQVLLLSILLSLAREGDDTRPRVKAE